MLQLLSPDQGECPAIPWGTSTCRPRLTSRRLLQVCPGDFVEHFFTCSGANGSKKASPLQRLALHTLLLELQLPAPFMRSSWDTERPVWRTAVIQASVDPEGGVRELASLLQQMESNMSEVLYKPVWAPRERRQLGDPVSDLPEESGAGDEENLSAGVMPQGVEVVEDMGEQLELVHSTRAASGYRGVFLVQKANQPVRFEAKYRDTSLGLYDTAQQAAIAYAREMQGQRVVSADGPEGGATVAADEIGQFVVSVRLRVKPPLKSAVHATGTRVVAQLHLTPHSMVEHSTSGLEVTRTNGAANVPSGAKQTPHQTTLLPAAKVRIGSAPSRSTRSKVAALQSISDGHGGRASKSRRVVAESDSEEDDSGDDDDGGGGGSNDGRGRHNLDDDMDASEQADEGEEDANTICEECGGIEDGINMLLCDGCDKGFHIYCLARPMLEVPDGDWFCKRCSDKSAQEAHLPYYVGCELRCKDQYGEWCSAVVDAMSPEAVLVHYHGRGVGDVNDEWIPIDAERLQTIGNGAAQIDEEEMDDDDDQACEVISALELQG